jgi:hypothetical protein
VPRYCVMKILLAGKGTDEKQFSHISPLKLERINFTCTDVCIVHYFTEPKLVLSVSGQIATEKKLSTV